MIEQARACCPNKRSHAALVRAPFLFVLLVMAACLTSCRSSTETSTRDTLRVLALLQGQVYSAREPNKSGTVIQWLVSSSDTAVLPPTFSTSAAMVSATYDSSRRAMFVGLREGFARISILELKSRQVVADDERSLPESVRDAENPGRNWDVLVNVGAGLLVLDELGIALVAANTKTFDTPGLLAIDMRTLSPRWFWPGRDVASLAAVGDSRGQQIWLGTKATGPSDGLIGSILRLDVSSFATLDSMPLPQTGTGGTFAYSLSAISSDLRSVFAVTPTVVYLCSELPAPKTCKPTTVPGTGVLVRATTGKRWLQLVSRGRERIGGPAAVRVVLSDGSIERTFDSAELRAASEGGIFGAIDNSGSRAILVFGANRQTSPANERGMITVLNLETGNREWSRQLLSDSITPVGVHILGSSRSRY